VVRRRELTKASLKPGERDRPTVASQTSYRQPVPTEHVSVDGGAPLRMSAILSAHRALMEHDATESFYAGRFRDVQNWIGGSDHSPRNALFVPPPPATVGTYMGDLVAFANRDDLPALAQAALVHAQFESIHPFTDGNGRIGRALINTVLRRRGVTTQVVVPLASALVAHRDRYFDLLDSYRDGHAAPIVTSFSTASQIAASESRVTAGRVRGFARLWKDQVGAVRRGSATSRLLARLAVDPVFTAERAHELIGGPTSSVYTAIERLHRAGVLRPLTDRRRNQVWGVVAVLDELDDLNARIAARTR
jgi:Fic family protein